MTADHDSTAAQPGCPDCGQDLSVEGDLLRCERHGTFFAYGPRLLVHTPQAHTRALLPLLPWETGIG